MRAGKDALIRDDMQTLSSVVANLKNVTTEYPNKIGNQPIKY